MHLTRSQSAASRRGFFIFSSHARHAPTSQPSRSVHCTTSIRISPRAGKDHFRALIVAVRWQIADLSAPARSRHLPTCRLSGAGLSALRPSNQFRLATTQFPNWTKHLGKPETLQRGSTTCARPKAARTAEHPKITPETIGTESASHHGERKVRWAQAAEPERAQQQKTT